MSGFSICGRSVQGDPVCPNIFSFLSFMSAAVAAKRTGTPSTYLRECADFMTEVVGRRLSISDPLPEDFDWRLSAAVDAANAMMEYDS